MTQGPTADESTRVFGDWWGGHSYAEPYTGEHTEVFDSVESARDALVERYESNGNRECDYNYLNGESGSTAYPAVGTESEMRVYLYDPTEVDNPIPDMVIRLCAWDDGEVSPYKGS